MSVNQQEKTGVIQQFYDSDTGVILENVSGATRDFYHPGAQVQFVQGDSVVYILISLPNGRTIVKDVAKPPQG
jgi:hypothetical protein